MSLEAGIVQLVQDDSNVLAICPVGGFAGQLPPNQSLPSWRHVSISQQTDYTLRGASALRMRRIQIDSYGRDADETITLASAIDRVLSGYQGILPDVDATKVAVIFQDNLLDFFDDAGKSWRRMQDYIVWYYQT